MFLICGNPHPQFSSTTQFSLHFYTILGEKKREEKDAGIVTIPPLTGGLHTLRWGLLRISVRSLALRRPLTMTWTLSKSNPRCCLTFPTLISVTAGKISMRAFFPYGEIIWLNIHLTRGRALRKPQLGWSKALVESEVNSAWTEQRPNTSRAELGPSGDTLTLVSHGKQDRPGGQPMLVGLSYHFNVGLPSMPQRQKFRCGDCWLIKLSELVKKAL